MRPTPIGGSQRGCLVGAMAGALAVAAHGPGGGYPDPADLALLLIVSALTGWTAACAFGVTRCSRLAVLGFLALGQLGGHTVLSGMLAHSHSQTPGATGAYLPTGWMLTAHAVATLGCAALLLLAERLYTLASGAIRVILGPPKSPRISHRIRWPGAMLHIYILLPNGANGPRAPPLGA